MEPIKLTILATSDLHGKFMPYDYALNMPDFSGSLTQLNTLVGQLRNENTILLDAGDTIQDNESVLFIDHAIHPMILAMNEIGYDCVTAGNHDFNYGVPAMQRIFSKLNCSFLCGNVFEKNGSSIENAYQIIEKAGIRIGIIGMVTPNIKRWDASNLENYIVKNPVQETRKILDMHLNDADLWIGLVHMGIENEYNEPGSGVLELVEACPELAVVIAAHSHTPIEEMLIDHCIVVENKDQAATLSKISLTIEKIDHRYTITDYHCKLHQIASYPSDVHLENKLLPYHRLAIEDGKKVIGELISYDLLPEDEIEGITQAYLEDTPLVNLIHTVQLYYSHAKVSACCFTSFGIHFHPGPLTKSDIALIYKYTNTLYKVQMTGKQLKAYMEYSASYYNQFHSDDLTISFDPAIRDYNYDLFGGIHYEINLSKKAGNRIENLCWLDGKAIGENEVFDVAVCNYRANTQLLTPGEIYTSDNLPVLIEKDINGMQSIRSMIIDYICNVTQGKIIPDSNQYWKITGASYNESLHQKAAELINRHILPLYNSQDGRTRNIKSITIQDLQEAINHDQSSHF